MDPDALVWTQEWFGQKATLESAGLKGEPWAWDPYRHITRLSVRYTPDTPVGRLSLTCAPRCHFVIPARPDVREGRFEIYRLHRDGAILEGPDQAIIQVLGSPVSTASHAVFTELVTAYLSTRYDLSDHAISAALEAFPSTECR